jgi:hypothetical protein
MWRESASWPRVGKRVANLGSSEVGENDRGTASGREEQETKEQRSIRQRRKARRKVEQRHGECLLN